ncbi:MAG TPA: hypothetical protein V6D17_02050 [Candidatus Obscuribacterales bacterium]
MENKTCPKCKRIDRTDFSTCRFCGTHYTNYAPPKASGEGFDTGAFLRNGGLTVVLIGAAWFGKPLFNSIVAHATDAHMSKAVDTIDQTTGDLDSEPQNTEALLKRAEASYVVGDVESALADYNAAIAREPRSPEIYRRRAHFYESIGEMGKAQHDRLVADQLSKK